MTPCPDSLQLSNLYLSKSSTTKRSPRPSGPCPRSQLCDGVLVMGNILNSVGGRRKSWRDGRRRCASIPTTRLGTRTLSTAIVDGAD